MPPSGPPGPSSPVRAYELKGPEAQTAIGADVNHVRFSVYNGEPLNERTLSATLQAQWGL